MNIRTSNPFQIRVGNVSWKMFEAVNIYPVASPMDGLGMQLMASCFRSLFNQRWRHVCMCTCFTWTPKTGCWTPRSPQKMVFRTHQPYFKGMPSIQVEEQYVNIVICPVRFDKKEQTYPHKNMGHWITHFEKNKTFTKSMITLSDFHFETHALFGVVQIITPSKWWHTKGPLKWRSWEPNWDPLKTLKLYPIDIQTPPKTYPKHLLIYDLQKWNFIISSKT